MRTFWFVVFVIGLIASLAHVDAHVAAVFDQTLQGIVAGDTVR